MNISDSEIRKSVLYLMRSILGQVYNENDEEKYLQAFVDHISYPIKYAFIGTNWDAAEFVSALDRRINLGVTLCKKDGYYDVSINDVLVGEIYAEVDGYYVFVYKGGNGYWDSMGLRLIANKLDEMNGEWDQQIRQYFEKQGMEDADH